MTSRNSAGEASVESANWFQSSLKQSPQIQVRLSLQESALFSDYHTEFNLAFAVSTIVPKLDDFERRFSKQIRIQAVENNKLVLFEREKAA